MSEQVDAVTAAEKAIEFHLQGCETCASRIAASTLAGGGSFTGCDEYETLRADLIATDPKVPGRGAQEPDEFVDRHTYCRHHDLFDCPLGHGGIRFRLTRGPRPMRDLGMTEDQYVAPTLIVQDVNEPVSEATSEALAAAMQTPSTRDPQPVRPDPTVPETGKRPATMTPEDLEAELAAAAEPEPTPLTVERLTAMADQDLRVQEIRALDGALARDIAGLANLKVLGRVLHLLPTVERPAGPGGRPWDENTLRAAAQQSTERIERLIAERVEMEEDGRLLPMPTGLNVASNGHREPRKK